MREQIKVECGALQGRAGNFPMERRALLGLF